MAKAAKTKKAKYKKGETLVLKNAWSMQFGGEGLPALVKDVNVDKEGNPMYAVDVERPPLPVVAQESELHPRK